MRNDYRIDRPPVHWTFIIPFLLGFGYLIYSMVRQLESTGIFWAIAGLGTTALFYRAALDIMWATIFKNASELFYARKPLILRKTGWSVTFDRVKFQFRSRRQSIDIPWVSMKGIYVKEERRRFIERRFSAGELRTIILVTNHEQDMKLREKGVDLDSRYVYRDDLDDLGKDCHVLEVEFENNARHIKKIAQQWQEMEAKAAASQSSERARATRNEGLKDKLMSDRIAHPETEGVADG